MYYVYILKCADETLYTGITTDITRRIQEHNGELPRGAKYTASRRPVTCVFAQNCKNRSEASKKESMIKKLTRSEKLNLIKS